MVKKLSSQMRKEFPLINLEVVMQNQGRFRGDSIVFLPSMTSVSERKRTVYMGLETREVLALVKGETELLGDCEFEVDMENQIGVRITVSVKKPDLLSALEQYLMGENVDCIFLSPDLFTFADNSGEISVVV